MQQAEKTANILMQKDGIVWNKLSINSGTELYADVELQKKYVAEVTKFASKMKQDISKNADEIYALIEDDNYHSLNNTLSLLGFFGEGKKKQYLASYKTSQRSSMNPAAFPNLGISTESVRRKNRVIENLVRSLVKIEVALFEGSPALSDYADKWYEKFKDLDELYLYPQDFKDWLDEDDTWAETYVLKYKLKSIYELFYYWLKER